MLRVSIRAPAKGRRPAALSARTIVGFDPRPREGATRATEGSGHGRRCFDPRPREGATRIDDRDFVDERVSIRAPAKGRRSSYDATRRIPGFDPRPREGATPSSHVVVGICLVSIRAPAKGRPYSNASSDNVICFDPRPREGATARNIVGAPQTSCFDPRPREGATRRPHGVGLDVRVSIRAPREGATRRAWHRVKMNMFRSAPPRRGDGSRSRWVLQVRVSIRAPAKGRPPPFNTLSAFAEMGRSRERQGFAGVPDCRRTRDRSSR